jgi:hypothetical protein
MLFVVTGIKACITIEEIISATEGIYKRILRIAACRSETFG